LTSTKFLNKISELKPFGVTCVSLWPSFVRTELATLEANEVQFSKAAGMTSVLYFVLV